MRRSAPPAAARRPEPTPEVLRLVVEAARSKKATAPIALDLRDLDGVCDYFVIVSGSSDVQVKAIAEAVEDRLREHGHRPWHVEGMENRRWVLLDYVEFVVHVFHEKTRDYYLLDRLWGDARSVDLGLDGTD
jgi:ribosome-associated protein